MESPRNSVAVAARERWIKHLGISGGGVQKAEADAFAGFGPSAAEGVSVGLGFVECGPALHRVGYGNRFGGCALGVKRSGYADIDCACVVVAWGES